MAREVCTTCGLEVLLSASHYSGDGRCISKVWRQYEVDNYKAGRPEPPSGTPYALGVTLREMERLAGQRVAELEKMAAALRSAPVVRRWLVWRGKKFEEGLCTSCGRTTALAPAFRPEAAVVGNYLISYKGNRCSRCLFKLIDVVDRAASELRAACAGGTWTEPEAKP